ncbi:MAG: hypothetical protein LBL45_05170, partial [Treponema sp.]|nr:hypothetical protein [Treponema sp.]
TAFGLVNIRHFPGVPLNYDPRLQRAPFFPEQHSFWTSFGRFMGFSGTSATIHWIEFDFLSSAFFPGGANAPSSISVSSTHWIAKRTAFLQTPHSAATLPIV